MKHDVYWQPEAEDELAELWLNAVDRPLVTRVAFRMDQRLETDPEGESESRPQDVRIIFEAPLGALFRVDKSARRVDVLHVWQFGKRHRKP